MKTSSPPTPEAFKIYFTRKFRRCHRCQRVKTVLAADESAARDEFQRNIDPELQPTITAVIPVFWSDQAGRYVTVPEAV